MTKLIIIQAAFAALCILESFHDAAVISIQDYRLPHYETASKLWHKYSAWYVTGVALLLALRMLVVTASTVSNQISGL